MPKWWLLAVSAHGVNTYKHQYKQTSNENMKWILSHKHKASIISKAARPWSTNMQQHIHHTQFFLSDAPTQRAFHWMEMDSESFGFRRACLQFCRQNCEIDELLLILIMASYQYYRFWLQEKKIKAENKRMSANPLRRLKLYRETQVGSPPC